MYARIELRGRERLFIKVPSNVDVMPKTLGICKHEQGLDVCNILNVFTKKFEESIGELIRLATEDDKRLLRSYEIKERNIFPEASRIIKKHKLNIKLVDIQIHFDGQRMTLYFLSEKRVDFRSLVKELAAKFHTRIRMKQIGVRDYAKHLSGVGPCGFTQCCNRFLNNFETISLQHLKDQNLSMTPQKVSGMCGRLLCCLEYERDFYVEAYKKFPPLYAKVDTEKYGSGKIIKLDIFNDKITVQYDNVEENGGVVIHSLDEFNKIKKKEIEYIDISKVKEEQ